MKTNGRCRLSSLMLRSTTKPWLYNYQINRGSHSQVCCPCKKKKKCFLAEIVLLGFLSLEWKRRGCIFTLWKCSHKHMDRNMSKNCNCCLPVKENWPCTGRGMFSFLPSMAVNLGIVLWSSWNLVGKGEGFNLSVMFSVVRKQNLTTAFEEASLFFSEGEI